MYAYATMPSAWSGLGDVQTAQQNLALGAGTASVATGVLGALRVIPASVIPFIGPALTGITLAVSAIIKNSGCGQTCIETSSWANQAAQVLDQNIQAYFAQPVPRSQSSQTLALQNFDQVWAQLVKLCGQSSTGNAGVRCISDRQRGACTWHQTADKVPAWGTPAAGECWNWFNGYRDPIANDPNVVPDSTLQSVAGGIASSVGLPNALQAAGINPSYAVPILLLVAGLIVAGVLL